MLKKIFLSLFIIFTTAFSVSILSPTEVSAASCAEFLGMKAWYCETGLVNEDGTPVSSITEKEIKEGIPIAITNITGDVLIVVGYITLGFVLYGGYLYICSSGDPSKTAAGKKTLTNAFIGLAIVASAEIILKSIGTALAIDFNAGKDCIKTVCVDEKDMVTSAISWVIGIAGVVSSIFVLYGGISYITSAGDAGKLRKAKDTILYSLIGVIICALGEVITNFVIIDIINKATASADEKIANVITSIISSIILIVGLVAVAFILVGGVKYMTSAGDPTKVKQARSTILYAGIGLVISALTFVIVNFVIGTILNQ